MEKRFGRLAGVSHRVKGMRPSVSIIPLCCFTQSVKGIFSAWIALRPASRSPSERDRRVDGEDELRW